VFAVSGLPYDGTTGGIGPSMVPLQINATMKNNNEVCLPLRSDLAVPEGAVNGALLAQGLLIK
jgi:hypothetical protein